MLHIIRGQQIVHSVQKKQLLLLPKRKIFSNKHCATTVQLLKQGKQQSAEPYIIFVTAK